MNTVSSVGSATDRSASEKPADSAASTMRGTSRSEPRICSSTPSAIGACPRCESFQLGSKGRGESVSVACRLDRHDGVGADAALEFGRGVEREDLAVVHDRHPVAQLVGFLHVVRGQHDGLPLGVEALEQIPQGQASLGVEPGGGLVEEENGRPVEDGAAPPSAAAPCRRRGRRRRLSQSGSAGIARAGRWPSRRDSFAPIPNRRPCQYRFSQGVNWRSSVFCWDTTPMSCFTRVGCWMTSSPPTRACPPVGITRVVSTPTVVVLPAPLGPRRPNTSPVPTSRFSSSTARKSVPGYVLVRLTVSMIGAPRPGDAPFERRRGGGGGHGSLCTVPGVPLPGPMSGPVSS